MLYTDETNKVVRLPILRHLPFSKVGEWFSVLINFLVICLSLRRSEGSQKAVIIDQKKLNFLSGIFMIIANFSSASRGIHLKR